MNVISKVAASLLLGALSLQAALAQQDAPAPPDEVFRYVVFDAGDALEIDWAIDDGAYLYRDTLGFESGNADIVFGEPELPEGKVYTDEFLGEQVIYRGKLFVRIPYSVKGDKPESLALTINSRGCLDEGFCYMPQTWIETVEMQSLKPANNELDLGAFGGLSGNSQSDFPPPDEVFFPDVFAVDGNTVEVGFRVIPGFYLYKDKISVTAVGNTARAGNLELPKGKSKTDEFFGEQEVYYNEVIGRLSIARATPDAMDLDLEVSYQGCADGGLCYLPQTKVLTVSLPEASAIADLSALRDRAASGAPVVVSVQSQLAKIIKESSIWVVIGVFFVAGLGLSLTPCVLPMVPILSGIIAGEGDDVSPLRGFTLAFSYVMGMALIYTGAGIAAAATGMQLQATFNQPWILILFSGLFVVLALGMFGAYELQMPSGIQSKLANVSGNQKTGTMVGAFVMGAISSLVVTACVAPPLIAALTVIGQTGDMGRGGMALFTMSLGMGAPLLLVGAAQGQLLPKAGPWMNAIKGAFGFMMLGLAIWMMSRILPGGVTLALWATLVFIAGVFMGGLTSLTSSSSIAQKLGKGFGFLAILYGLAMYYGAMHGGSNPLRPLANANVTLGAGNNAPKAEHLKFTHVKSVDDLDREIAAAVANGKTAMLDFYADWCVSCIEMEEYTFITDEVQDALANTVAIQADVTKNDPVDQELLKRFGVYGPPTIIFFDTNGNQLKGYEVVGFMKSADFANHVKQAFAVSSAPTESRAAIGMSFIGSKAQRSEP